MKKILFAIALAVVATACHTPESETTAQMGKIVINAATRSEVTTTSEEGRFYLTNLPSVDDLKVEIEGNGETKSWATLSEFNLANENMRFESAPYTITLSHGEKGVEGWSKPYFEGSVDVEVPMYNLTAEANVEVVLQNSIVAIETTEEFDGFFPQSSFKVKNFKWEADKGEHLFLNAGEVTITCDAKRESGKSEKFETTLTLDPTTRHRVVFELSIASGVKVNVRFDDEIVEVIEQEFELNDNA